MNFHELGSIYGLKSCFVLIPMLHIFFSVFCLNVLPEAIKPPCLIETHSQSPQDINSNDYNADAAGNLNQLFPKHLNKFTATTKTDTKL